MGGRDSKLTICPGDLRMGGGVVLEKMCCTVKLFSFRLLVRVSGMIKNSLFIQFRLGK